MGGRAVMRAAAFVNAAARQSALQQQTRSFTRTVSALDVKKIAVKNAVVDLDGDEMTRIIW